MSRRIIRSPFLLLWSWGCNVLQYSCLFFLFMLSVSRLFRSRLVGHRCDGPFVLAPIRSCHLSCSQASFCFVLHLTNQLVGFRLPGLPLLYPSSGLNCFVPAIQVVASFIIYLLFFYFGSLSVFTLFSHCYILLLNSVTNIIDFYYICIGLSNMMILEHV